MRENRRVSATILTTYSNGFFGISYAQFLPYFAQEVLHVGPAGYGVLVSAPGVGAVLISFFLSTHTRLRGMRRLLVGASLIYAVAIFLFALSPFLFSFDLAAGGRRLDADELSRAGAGDHSRGMSRSSARTRHEFVFSRPRFRLAGRDLHRQCGRADSGAVGGGGQRAGLRIGLLAPAQGRRQTEQLALIDRELPYNSTCDCDEEYAANLVSFFWRPGRVPG